MKTIFITIFEGVESKNILRTDILKTLLKQPDICLVLFTKSADRASYHQKEFNDPRIIYEVVEIPRVYGLDKLFQKLKFVLLRTGTMDLRRRMRLQADGSYLDYAISVAANRLFARPFFRRIFRWLDLCLIRRATFAPFFEKYHPDLVVMASLFDEQELELLREARRRRVRTAGFINSWDRTTARCALRNHADTFVVFNDTVKEEMIVYQDVPREKIFVGGIPQYDQYIHFTSWSREEFMKRAGGDPRKKLIVYSPIGSAYSNSDWDVMDLLHRLIEEKKFGPDVQMLVRFSPNEFIQKEELTKRPWLRYDHPGVRFSRVRGIDWDMTFSELEYLSNTLHYMSLLICYASSISVDAAVFDKPVININFEIKDNKLLSKSPTQFYRMTHYRKALDTGGIRLVQSEEELITRVKNYLDDPALDQEKRKALVASQCKFLDGKSGERIGKFLLKEVETVAGK